MSFAYEKTPSIITDPNLVNILSNLDVSLNANNPIEVKITPLKINVNIMYLPNNELTKF